MLFERGTVLYTSPFASCLAGLMMQRSLASKAGLKQTELVLPSDGTPLQYNQLSTKIDETVGVLSSRKAFVPFDTVDGGKNQFHSELQRCF